MRGLRETVTLAAGAAPVSAAILLQHELLVGIYFAGIGSGLTAVKIQALVAGNLDDAASQTWVDIYQAAADGTITNLLQVVPGADRVVLFNHDTSSYVPAVIRLKGVGTLTGTLTARVLTDSHH